MSRFRKFFQLTTAERFLLLRALSLVGAVRFSLWLLPFNALRRLLSDLIQRRASTGKKGTFSVERGIWAVQAAGRYVPRASCLTQALAAQLLLGLAGIPACVQIGVAKEGAGKFEAHAWLESDGKILMGGADAERQYVRLLSLNP